MTERELHDGLEKAVKRAMQKMQTLMIERSNEYFKFLESKGERSFMAERAQIIDDTLQELESLCQTGDQGLLGRAIGRRNAIRMAA